MDQVTNTKINFIETALGSFRMFPQVEDRIAFLDSELLKISDQSLRVQLNAYVDMTKDVLLEVFLLLLKTARSSPPSSSEGAFVYRCTFKNGRLRKCFRTSLFSLAERHHGFIAGDCRGITCNGRDIEISLLFKEKSKMFDFQSSVRGYGGVNKRQSLESEDGKEGNSEEDTSLKLIDEETSEKVFIYSNLVRVFAEHYSHFDGAEGAFNSPPCDKDGDSISILSAEVVNVREAETRAQMLEDVTADTLFGQSPEVAHIKDKCACQDNERNDINNKLHLSRPFHQHFDGIETYPIMTPSFIIKYKSHDNVPIDCPLFGENAVVINPLKKRKKLVVHIIFRDEVYCSHLSKSLRNGAVQIDSSTYQLDLYFENPEKTKTYLDWKEKKTLEAWKDIIEVQNCSDSSSVEKGKVCNEKMHK